MRGKKRREGSTKIIKGRQHTSFGILSLSNLILLLEMFSLVTCHLARVFQAENSPFLEGNSNATLEGFIHYHPEEICREISSIVFSLPQQCVFLEDAVMDLVWPLQHSSKGLLLGEIRRRRLNRFVGYSVILRARSGSNIHE